MVRITALLTFATAALAVVTTNNAGAKDVGAGNGQQFTTGGCVNDADCQSGCCAGGAITTTLAGASVGVCSAAAASTQNGKTGCGFVDPNAAATIAAAKKQVAAQGF